MKSIVANLFLLFILSVVVIQVKCGDDDETFDDTIVVDAASEPDSDENEDNSIICTDTQEYSRCDANPHCQRTCDNLDQPAIVCPRRSCIEGCICKENFVRSELFGGCIPRDQCQRVKH